MLPNQQKKVSTSPEQDEARRESLVIISIP
jgi:hypothetical protein